MSNSLWHHGLQHARLPCPSPSPRACLNSSPSSRWCHPTISSSVVPFSCLQSFPESGSFLISWLFASGGLPWCSDGKSVCLQCGRPGFNPWVRKIPWRRKWQPTPVLLPGKSHGQRAWWTAVHWVTKNQTRLSDFTSLHLHQLASVLELQLQHPVN